MSFLEPYLTEGISALTHSNVMSSGRGSINVQNAPKFQPKMSTQMLK